MKTSLLLVRSLVLCGVLALPAIAQAGVSLDINVPGVSLHLGDQDNRGYYWDGYDWRPPQWWHSHKGGHIGDRNERGMYWNGGGWQQHRPEHRNNEPHNNGPRGHDNRGGDHGRGGPDNHGNANNHGGPDNHGGNRGGDNRGGEPVPPQGSDHRP